MNPCLLVLIAAALFAGAGCAALRSATTEDYERGDASQQHFASDAAVCAKLAEADQRNLGMGGEFDPTQATYSRMFDACMRASGYQRKSGP